MIVMEVAYRFLIESRPVLQEGFHVWHYKQNQKFINKEVIDAGEETYCGFARVSYQIALYLCLC